MTKVQVSAVQSAPGLVAVLHTGIS